MNNRCADVVVIDGCSFSYTLLFSCRLPFVLLQLNLKLLDFEMRKESELNVSTLNLNSANEKITGNRFLFDAKQTKIETKNLRSNCTH